MATFLAGDIGGTKTILSLFDVPTQGNRPFAALGAMPKPIPLLKKTFPSREYTDLCPLVQEFLAIAENHQGTAISPEAACFGIAGPVIDNASELTNLGWFLRTDTLRDDLNISHVSLLNDFAATGYGVLGLTSDDIYTLQAGEPMSHAPIAIIGAGTGLGQGFLIPHADGYHSYPSEGGHSDFAPRSELEFQLQHYLIERYNIDRVSAERVVSGMGIAAIYQFLRSRSPERESEAMGERYRQWEQQIGHEPKTIDLSAAVSKAAIAGEDALCEEAMNLFVDAYGAEAGNLALKLLPYGGLYVAGGIAAKNLPLMQTGRFMRAFARKGRVSPLLKQVPVHIVLNPDVALLGAALYAIQDVSATT
ncbi:glucokinase [Vacuolonema iberomarrocanum]|uniref:glucokinase n=1 Tax=Vacuolonema iberomarrocanum TaxID=3454632 RepID=UPI0019EF041D|nr:glucokinase [filamentous cyanobacterium LEGE 07170]